MWEEKGEMLVHKCWELDNSMEQPLRLVQGKMGQEWVLEGG